MEIVNPGAEDYHVHSFNFSDGLNTIEELVHWAGIFGLTTIGITDHSQATSDTCRWGKNNKSCRGVLKRWKNVHDNGVEVVFGVEGDLLNEAGDICSEIQGETSSLLILSAHERIYQGDPKKITEAYLKAIERHALAITFLGHPCIDYFEKYLDIGAVVEAANRHQLPLEFNCGNLIKGKTNLKNLAALLQKADRIYVNSDAHVLYELKTARKMGFEYLRENGYLT